MNLPAVRPWLILALIFLLGAATGSLLTIAFGPRPGVPGPKQMGERWMERLTEKLNLTEEQQKKIRPIVMDAEKQIVAAHREDVAKLGKIMEETHQKIEAQLQPEQQEALRELEKERERMFFRHTHGGHGPGDFHHPGDDDRPPPPPPGAEPPPAS